MKRTVLHVAVAALCVAGSAVAQDRSGQYLGSGGRAEDGGQIVGSGTAAGQTVGSGGFTTTAQDQWMGNGARAEDGRQVMGSGARTTDAGGMLGSGTRSEDAGGVIGSGTRSEDSSPLFGSGAGVIAHDGGYYGSGLSVRQLRLPDGSSVLVVSSDEGMLLIIPIEG